MVTAQASEIARRSAEVMWSADEASAALRMNVEQVSPGSSRVTMQVRPDMINGWGTCHGGMIASLADSAFALACSSHGTITVASGFTIDFLAPARLGDVLIADAQEVAVAGRSGVYDVTVRTSATVIAEFRGRSRSLNKPILEEQT